MPSSHRQRHRWPAAAKAGTVSLKACTADLPHSRVGHGKALTRVYAYHHHHHHHHHQQTVKHSKHTCTNTAHIGFHPCMAVI